MQQLSLFVGHFHPVLVHLPIGILLLALLFEYLSKREKFAALSASVPLMYLVGFITAVLSCISGFLLSQSGDYVYEQVMYHQWMGIFVALFSGFFAWRYRETSRKVPAISSGLLFISIVITGHLGGTLTHGEGYLDFFSGIATSHFDLADLDSLDQRIYFEDIVQPILQEKCVSCHGPSKQKGKLRLDGFSFIQKGGKDGAVIVANNPEESALINNISMPLEDEDHMPPKEKPQLSKTEIALLREWVLAGADEKKSLSELHVVEKIQALANASGENAVSNFDVPQESVSPADEKILEQLKKLGVSITPISESSNYLTASIRNALNFDSVFMLLPAISQQLIWLNAGSHDVTDSHTNALSKLTQLRRLHLNNSQVTDEGLSELKSLEQLHYLNLVGTNVSLAGLNALQPLTQLKELFLFHTKVLDSDTTQLRSLFPNATLEMGGYSLKSLASDTQLVQPPKTK